MKQTFKEFLQEAPINDYKTFGNWDKNSSFRDKRDRTIIRHPKAIERTKHKFANTDHMFNFYFVNSPAANKHTEVGIVPNIEWVRENLGDEVADAVQPNVGDDSINVIFTNNKGAERAPMTGWVMAHRILHAAARKNSMRNNFAYKEASDTLMRNLSYIMQFYGKDEFPNSDTRISGSNGWSNGGYENIRKNQLTMLYFFYEVATFKSARERNIRDWFEVLHELGAQYLTTGKIKFNDAPQTFGNKGGRNSMRFRVNDDDIDDVNGTLRGLAQELEWAFDTLFNTLSNEILVM